MKNYKSILLLFLFVVCSSAAAHAQQVFVANLSGAQEVPVVASPGRGVCQAILNAAQTQITVNCNYSALSSAATVATVNGSAQIGANAPVLFNLGAVSGTSGAITNQSFSVSAQQVADLRRNRMYVNVQTANNPNGEIRGQLHVANAIFDDYDGDGRTDPTVYRPSTGTWFNLLSLTNSLKAQQWGLATDLTSQNADFDGDGISDHAAIRPNPATGQLTTYILQSATNTLRAEVFGTAALGDRIGTGDFDGDGKYDLGIFRNGLWVYIESSTGAIRYFNWGQQNDSPAQGDFDRDGKSDFAVVRVVSGQLFWYIRLSSTGALKTVQLGQADNAALNRADFDGDGASDVTIVRNVNGAFEFVTVRSSDGATVTQTWGFITDTLRTGDFDGDGKHDYTVIRNENGSLIWYLLQSTNNQLRVAYWGTTGDR